MTFDFLVLSTGLITDPGLRPELAGLAAGHRPLGGPLRTARGRPIR